MRKWSGRSTRAIIISDFIGATWLEQLFSFVSPRFSTAAHENSPSETSMKKIIFDEHRGLFGLASTDFRTIPFPLLYVLDKPVGKKGIKSGHDRTEIDPQIGSEETPALLVASSVLVIKRVLVTEASGGYPRSFSLKGHGHNRFETSRMKATSTCIGLSMRRSRMVKHPSRGLPFASLVDK